MEIIPQTDLNKTKIQKFYFGQNILITGGTGFLGKILTEKLLRTCADINTIYMLIRAKKGKNMHQRVEELFDDPVFERLKEENPKFQHKVIGITGDCSFSGLGLSISDRNLLLSEVSIVFHVAATVKFDEKLRLATAINVQGTKDMFELSREMKKLKCIMHVSTAYANCVQEKIEEKFYPTPMNSNKLISLVNTTEDKILDNITPTLLGEWPNTYTYTKAIAEDLIRTDYTDLPIGVFRPAIVISTYNEPVKGWVDNMYGPTGICAGAGTGVLRTLPCDPTSTAIVVPCDLCVNALICSAWQVHKEHQKKTEKLQSTKTENDVPIYNYVSSPENQLTWQTFMDICAKYGVYYPSGRAVWYYCFKLNQYYFVHLLYVFFLQLIPALIVDGILLCFGKPPQLLKMTKKILKFTRAIHYFIKKNFLFSNDSVKRLLEELDKDDKILFQFDMNEVNWEEYFKHYVKGIRTYLLKEPLKTLPESMQRWTRLYWLHQLTKFVFSVIVVNILWSILTYMF